jgi:phosphoglycerate dehydrogenase-like enzyme
MPKVLIAPMTLAHLEGRHLRVLREAGFEIVWPSRPLQMVEDELDEVLGDVPAVLAGSEPYTARVLRNHPTLKVIARVGVGYDAVDVAAATAHGALVTIAPGTNQDSVAEHTFALMLAVAKQIVPQHLGVKAGTWPRGATQPLRGRTLGLAGLGRIGKAVALRGKVFGMKLLAYDPYPDTAFASAQGVTLVPFDDLLAGADYLSLHLPFTPASAHLINKRSLALMKPTAVLLNTSRGGVVCEADLADALKNKRLGGAGLDVFEQEPPEKNNPLFQFDNVVMTPHQAGTDVQSRDDMAASAAEAIVSLYQGEWPAEKIVNPEARAAFRWGM